MSHAQSSSSPLLQFSTELTASPARVAERQQLLDTPLVSPPPRTVLAEVDELADLRQRVDRLEKTLAQSAVDLRATRSKARTLVSLAGDIRKRTSRALSVVPFPSAPPTPRTMRIAGAIAGTVLGVAIVLWFWKATASAPLLPAPSVSITAERRPAPPASPAPPAVLPQSVTRPPVRAAIVPAAVVTRVDTTRVPAAVVTPVDTARARAATRPVEYVGALTIDSTPAGEVFIDRKPAGRTPMRAEQLKAGSHLIWIQQDGYQRFTRVVQVPADRVTRLVADLERAAR